MSMHPTTSYPSPLHAFSLAHQVNWRHSVAIQIIDRDASVPLGGVGRAGQFNHLNL